MTKGVELQQRHDAPLAILEWMPIKCSIGKHIMQHNHMSHKFQLKNDWADAERPQLCARSSNVDMAT